MTYIRRFTANPGIEVLLEIESVNILDIEPSAPLTSVGSGTVMLVGEFEKGPYNEPTEVFGPTDVAGTFGGFGFSYGGVVANNPCARSRHADLAVAAEYWNGNGMAALNGKRFSRLVLVRVDTSVGAVEFTRLASLLGNVQSTFALTTGQHVDFNIGGGPVVATFTGTPATMSGIAFPGGGGLSGFVGGEWVEFCYDDASLATTVRVYFLAADQTPAQVAARINLYFGFTFASTILAGTAIALTGRQGGTGGRVDIVNADAAATTVAIGLPQSATKGSDTSNAVFPVALAPGDTFVGKVDQQAVADTLTIAATTATKTGAAAAYGAGGAGDNIVLNINGIPGNQTIDLSAVGALEVDYLATINAGLVGAHVEDNGAGQLRIVTDRKGSGAGGNIVSLGGAAAAKTGLAPGAFVNPGPNNVIDVLAVTAAEFAGLLTATFVGGTAGSLGVAIGTTQVRWETNTAGITPKGVQFTGGTGVAKIAGFDLVEHNGTAAIPATASGAGNVVNISAVTVAEAHTVIHAASASVSVDSAATGAIRISNTGTPGTGTLLILPATTATAFGWATGTTASAATGTAGTIPAGTRVRNAGAVEWVTCQDVAVTADSAGPYSVKVRHALDDGTGIAALTGTVTTVYDAIEIDNFAVTNPQPLSIALTEAQIDVAYLAAFDATVDVNTVAHDVNTVYSARQSNAVRRKGRDNAQYASANGCFGRRFVMRPPLGTMRAVAKGTAEPGVGAYRHERVIYCYPGASVYLPAIATRGVGGGAGFTADGFIDLGADGFMAMLCSLLPPEENPGQITDYLNAVSGLESSTNVQGWTIDDYKSFKSNGIAALRMDAGTPEFQSGVTAVLPTDHPGQTRISRRRLADVLQDTMALRAKTYGKKLGTRARWSAMLGVFNDYLSGLKKAERIEDYKIDGKTGNTAESWALGVRWVIAYVKTIASMDSIVLQAEIGESINISAV